MLHIFWTRRRAFSQSQRQVPRPLVTSGQFDVRAGVGWSYMSNYLDLVKLHLLWLLLLVKLKNGRTISLIHVEQGLS